MALTIQQQAVIYASNSGYIIDEDGFVYNPRGRKISGTFDRGYRRLTIRMTKGSRVATGVGFHRLQAYQKYGMSLFEPKIEVRHKNGLSSDNSKENIILGTKSENEMDKATEVRMGAALKATAYVRKHDKEAVKAYHKEHGFKRAMEHFGISSKGTMSYIINH